MDNDQCHIKGQCMSSSQIYDKQHNYDRVV